MVESITPNFQPSPVEGPEGMGKTRKSAKANGPSFSDVLNRRKKSAGAVDDETAPQVATAQNSPAKPLLVDDPADQDASSPEDTDEETSDAGQCAAQPVSATAPTPAERLMMSGANPAAAPVANGTDSSTPADSCASGESAADAAGAVSPVSVQPALAENPAAQPAAVIQAKESSVAEEKFASLLSIADPEPQVPLDPGPEKTAKTEDIKTDLQAAKPEAVPLKQVSAQETRVEAEAVSVPASGKPAQPAASVQAEKGAAAVEKHPVDPAAVQRPDMVLNGEYSNVQMAATQEPARPAEAPHDVLSQITKNVQLIANQQQTSLRVHLHSQDLGAIDIRLVSNQNGVGIILLAEKASTSRMLESQMSQLQQTMLSAGVSVSQLFVGQDGQQPNAQASFLAQQGQERSPARDAQLSEAKKQGQQAPKTSADSRYSLIDYRV